MTVVEVVNLQAGRCSRGVDQYGGSGRHIAIPSTLALGIWTLLRLSCVDRIDLAYDCVE